MRCQACGREVWSGASVCPHCLAQIDPNAKVEEMPASPSAPVYCRVCGSAMPEKSTFCPNCATGRDEKARKTNLGCGIVGLVLAAIPMLFFGSCFLMPTQGEYGFFAWIGRGLSLVFAIACFFLIRFIARSSRP